MQSLEIGVMVISAIAATISLLQKVFATSESEWFKRWLSDHPILRTVALNLLGTVLLGLAVYSVSELALRLAKASDIGKVGIDFMSRLGDLTQGLLLGTAVLIFAAQAAVLSGFLNRIKEGQLKKKKKKRR